MYNSQQVSRVIVVPLSGYVNRLQAIASSSIVADQFNAEFLVCWTDINVTPAPAEEVFSPKFVAQHLIDQTKFREFSGLEYNQVPAYLNVKGNVISLAGLDKGEQVFMPELLDLIEQSEKPVTLVFSAGGNFSFTDPVAAGDQRGDWYRNFTFSDAIESRVEELLVNRGPFIGLHLRYTDRSHETPLAKAIDRAITSQAELIGADSVFIASDTEKEKDKWLRKLEKAGLKPWVVETALNSSISTKLAVGALVDWKVLGHARSSVFFSASSFGHEAAVMAASLGTSTALHGHAIQRVRSRVKELTGSLVNYPRNHWLN